MLPQETKLIRILLVDDQRSIREGYRMLLEVQPDIKVVAETGRSDEALELASREAVDIILLDLDLGAQSPESGLDIIPKLRAANTEALILILTGASDLETHQEAARRGAMGLVNKDQSFQFIVKAIRKVYAGEAWFDRALFGAILTERGNAARKAEDPEVIKIASLTERELEIIKLVGHGLKNKEIGQQLNPHIGETTVRNHLNTIFNKLEIKGGRFELLIYAYRHGLASPPILENN